MKNPWKEGRAPNLQFLQQSRFFSEDVWMLRLHAFLLKTEAFQREGVSQGQRKCVDLIFCEAHSAARDRVKPSRAPLAAETEA